MANTYPTGFQGDNPDAPAAAADRGLFDCFGKKEEKEDVPMTDAGHKLHSSNSSSSSSSEEEVEEGGVKIRRRKKKGLTDKIKEKLPGHKKEGSNAAVAEGNYNHPCAAAANEEEKKGVFEKLKEKLPGNHKDEPVIDRHPTPAPGILDKIKEKLPGHHKDEAEIAPRPNPATAPAHTYAAAPASAYSEAPPPAYSAAPAHSEAPAPAYSAAQAPASDHCQLGGHCGDIHAAHEQPEKKGIFEMIKEKLPGGHKDGEVKKDH